MKIDCEKHGQNYTLWYKFCPKCVEEKLIELGLKDYENNKS